MSKSDESPPDGISSFKSKNTAQGESHRSEQRSREHRVRDLINELLSATPYEAIETEVHSAGVKRLRVFIDFRLGSQTTESPPPVGIEDCVNVNRCIDEPLDAAPLIEEVFQGPYELEVSSPGLDRPMSRAEDFLRFCGSLARIQTIRPLTVDECENPTYLERNPKQRNFIGFLRGVDEGKVRIDVPLKKDCVDSVSIPLSLVQRACRETEGL